MMAQRGVAEEGNDMRHLIRLFGIEGAQTLCVMICAGCLAALAALFRALWRRIGKAVGRAWLRRCAGALLVMCLLFSALQVLLYAAVFFPFVSPLPVYLTVSPSGEWIHVDTAMLGSWGSVCGHSVHREGKDMVIQMYMQLYGRGEYHLDVDIQDAERIWYSGGGQRRLLWPEDDPKDAS